MKLGKAAQTELSILREIQAAPYTSRVELARQSGLSTSAITGIVGSLIAKGVVVEGAGMPGVGIGRKRIGLTLHPSLGYVVGVDLGTFNLRITVSDLNGISISKRELPTQIWRGRDEVLRTTFALIHETVAEAGIDKSKLLGIGIAFSGVINVQEGMVISYPRPGQVESWRRFPLREICEQEFGIPCLLEDSVRAIATEERTVGGGRNYSDFVYVDVGFGIGSAIFIGGKIYRGCNGSAGEFGHMTVAENGPLCCCGNHGCLEAMASGATLIDIVKMAITKGVTSRVLELAGSMDGITLEVIAEAARDNDSLACRALSEVAQHIGTACADVVNLLNPEAILFGGALFRAAPELVLDHIKRMVRHRAMEKSANDVQLQIAQTKGDAGAHGIAKLVAERVIDRALTNRM
ncbi:MAG: ROK family transcriptional regulator [Acidobacteria bacterium]|nr:ROK family transcriptional regulator [Acidobacteriota bacterium]